VRRWKLVGGGNLRHGGCLEDMDKTVQGIQNIKKLLTQNSQEIQDTMKKPNLKIIGIEESEHSQYKEPKKKNLQQNQRRKRNQRRKKCHKCTRSLSNTKYI
jgi:hypothetical protein